jgi:hypothetical protein
VKDSFFKHSHNGRYGESSEEDKTGKKTQYHGGVKGLLAQVEGSSLEDQTVMGNPAKILGDADECHAYRSNGRKKISGTTGQENGRKGNMEDEKKDERTYHPSGEVDEKEHRDIIKTHLPVGETFDKFLLAGLTLDPPAQKKEKDIIEENETG